MKGETLVDKIEFFFKRGKKAKQKNKNPSNVLQQGRGRVSKVKITSNLELQARREM